MVPFLYNDLTSVVKSLLRRFVKSDVIDNAKCLTTIDLKKESNLIGVKHVNIGHGARAALSDVKVSDLQILTFKADCRKCLITICEKMCEKSPLAYNLTKSLSFCDPRVVPSLKVAKSRLSSLATVLVKTKWLAGFTGDRIEQEFEILCSKPAVRQLALDYDRNTKRLDVFWKNVVRDFGGSNELFNLLKLVFVLFHGQADVERGFSVNKEILVENLSEKSLVSQRLVWQGIQKAGGVKNVSINKSMILSARNARSLYREDLDRRKKEREEEEVEFSRKRKNKELIAALQEKKRAMAAQLDAIDDEIRLLK